MNDFNKSIELKYRNLPPTPSKKGGPSESLPPESFRSDNLAVLLLILVGIIGLSYIPKSPFSKHLPQHSAQSLTSEQVYASAGFSLAATPSSSAVEVLERQTHPQDFKLSAQRLADGQIQFSLEGAQADWTYQLKIDDLASVRLEEGKAQWLIDQAGIYSLELKAKKGRQSELLEIREIIIE